MTEKQLIDYAYEHGNVHQKYIIKRDVIGENIHSAEMEQLQSEILVSNPVKWLRSSQNEDGWFGIELHGGPSKAMDSTSTLLRELGVEAYHDFMQKAREAVLLDKIPYRPKHNAEGFDRGYNFSRSVSLAAFQRDEDDAPELLKDAYSRIFEIFENSLRYEGVDEFSRECTDKKHIGMRTMLKEHFLPWISDVNVLAQCDKWRNPRTEQLTDEAFTNIGRLMPITVTLEPYKGRYLGTVGNYLALNFDNPFDSPRGDIVWWVSSMTNLCKVTDVKSIPWFRRHLDCIRALAAEDKLFDRFSDEQMNAFSDFFSFGIKKKSEKQRKADICFKFGMILHYADR